jgi:hypothetical protein
VERIDEPKGWRHLQEMAQQEQDPQVLAAIIDKMNRLLDQHDWSASPEGQPLNHYGSSPNCAVGLETRSRTAAGEE